MLCIWDGCWVFCLFVSRPLGCSVVARVFGWLLGCSEWLLLSC